MSNKIGNYSGMFKMHFSMPNPAITGVDARWVGHGDYLDDRRGAMWAMIELGGKLGCDMSSETSAACRCCPVFLDNI